MKTIQKLSKAKFKISTDNVPNSDLSLNFNPLIDEFKLQGDYLLIHWQGMPKGYRQWGIYNSQTDSYHSVKNIDFDRPQTKAIQLDDKTATTKPSAVLLVTSARLILIDSNAIVCTRLQLIDVGGDSWNLCGNVNFYKY